MSSTIKCAIYLRVSTKSQDTSNQLQPLKEYVERMGYELVGVYEDHGVSGVKSSRPQLDQMMIDGRRKKFSLILSWSIDRIGRNMTHLCQFVDEMNQLGINLYFHTQSIDTTTSVGKMFFHIISSISTFERELIRERVICGLERCKQKGVKLGRPSSMNDGLRNAILILKEKGVGVRETCRQLGIGTNSYYSVVKELK
jgi:DNA invertase Pin-like site-specific DNA recombinase